MHFCEFLSAIVFWIILTFEKEYGKMCRVKWKVQNEHFLFHRLLTPVIDECSKLERNKLSDLLNCTLIAVTDSGSCGRKWRKTTPESKIDWTCLQQSDKKTLQRFFAFVLYQIFRIIAYTLPIYLEFYIFLYIFSMQLNPFSLPDNIVKSGRQQISLEDVEN